MHGQQNIKKKLYIGYLPTKTLLPIRQAAEYCALNTNIIPYSTNVWCTTGFAFLVYVISISFTWRKHDI